MLPSPRLIGSATIAGTGGATARNRPDPRAANGERRVLVVDDDRDTTDALKLLLEVHGYTVATAYSGKQALAVESKLQPDVAIVDYRLGGTNGIELAAQLKERRPNLYCVLITAYADLDNLVQAMRGGIEDYMSKPVNPDELFVALDRGFENLALSRQKQAAERALLAAKEEADRANRAKSDFFAQMSHELRTPLNAIVGFSEIMSRQMLGPLDNAQYLEYAGDIHDSATHLLKLITDILDLAKIEAGRQELYEESVDVGQIIESGLTLLEERAADAGIAIEARVAENLPKLHADGRKVKQVVINLLSNAVKFTRSGGKIVISAEVRAPGRLAISVADSGIGIMPEDLNRVMRPFEQVDGALDHKNEGTGLGLPLSKVLVELHGGSLELTSEVGVGTTVTAYFPAHRVVAGKSVAELRRDT